MPSEFRTRWIDEPAVTGLHFRKWYRFVDGKRQVRTEYQYPDGSRELEQEWLPSIGKPADELIIAA